MSGRTPPRVAGDNCDGGRRRRARMPTARAVSRGSSRGYQAKISYSEMMHLVEHGEAFEHDDTSFRRRKRLAVRPAIPFALELPRWKAADVDVELIQSGVVTIAAELDLELHLIPRDGLAAHRADHTNSWPTPSTIGSLGRHHSSADRFSGFGAQNSLIGHASSPRSGVVVMPNARRPGRLFASPREPDGRPSETTRNWRETGPETGVGRCSDEDASPG